MDLILDPTGTYQKFDIFLSLNIFLYFFCASYKTHTKYTKCLSQILPVPIYVSLPASRPLILQNLVVGFIKRLQILPVNIKVIYLFVFFLLQHLTTKQVALSFDENSIVENKLNYCSNYYFFFFKSTRTKCFAFKGF